MTPLVERCNMQSPINSAAEAVSEEVSMESMIGMRAFYLQPVPV